MKENQFIKDIFDKELYQLFCRLKNLGYDIEEDPNKHLTTLFGDAELYPLLVQFAKRIDELEKKIKEMQEHRTI